MCMLKIKLWVTKKDVTLAQMKTGRLQASFYKTQYMPFTATTYMYLVIIILNNNYDIH